MHRNAVHDVLLYDVAKGRKAGPFTYPPFSTFIGSPLGAFQRKRSGKYRVIHDLSWPPGLSVNDFISSEDSTVQYISFDDVIRRVQHYGRDALMSTMDLADAYKSVLVRPEDWDLLGITWITDDNNTQYYVDLTLPFGLRSSAKLFSEIADALLLSMKYNGATEVHHYLDDFITIGPANSPQCSNNLEIMLSTSDYIGFEVNDKKTTTPATTIQFLGFIIDSKNYEIRIADDRLNDILIELHTFLGRKMCSKRELLSLMGKLIFISRVVKSGRSFVRRIIDLSKRIKHLHHRVRLNRACRDDILWWSIFLPRWNGVCLIPEPDWTHNADIDLYTDASDVAIGCYFARHWFVVTFSQHYAAIRHESINFRELFAITAALSTWGRCLKRKKVLLYCDNLSVVQILNSGVSKNTKMMHLVRTIFFICSCYNFECRATHISSIDNSIADSLSRLEWTKFKQLVPLADTEPVEPVIMDWTLY